MSIPATAQDLGQRIVDLYGQPLPDLQAHVDAVPHNTLLGALLASHSALELAEQHVEFQLATLRRFTDVERPLEAADARHLHDATRRLLEAVAVRDTQQTTLRAVLQSLHRRTPTNTPPVASAPPAPTAAAAPVRSR